jgi:hypothetical protein
MKVIVTINGTNPKEAFEAGAFWAEYDKHCSKCGCCGSENTMPVYRSTVAKQGANIGKRFDQYESKCLDCGATFAFGQQQDEKKSLYPGKKNMQSGQVVREWKPKFEGSGGGYNSGGNAPDDENSPPF